MKSDLSWEFPAVEVNEWCFIMKKEYGLNTYHLSIWHWPKAGDKYVGLNFSHFLCKVTKKVIY